MSPTQPPDRFQPGGEADRAPELAEATAWFSRILTWVSPGVLGLFVDYKYGTRFLGLAGFILGAMTAVVQLVYLSREMFRKTGRGENSRPDSAGREEL